jgi:hypothetical protein
MRIRASKRYDSAVEVPRAGQFAEGPSNQPMNVPSSWEYLGWFQSDRGSVDVEY